MDSDAWSSQLHAFETSANQGGEAAGSVRVMRPCQITELLFRAHEAARTDMELPATHSYVYYIQRTYRFTYVLAAPMKDLANVLPSSFPSSQPTCKFGCILLQKGSGRIVGRIEWQSS